MSLTGLENLFIICGAAFAAFAFAGALAALGDYLYKKWYSNDDS